MEGEEAAGEGEIRLVVSVFVLVVVALFCRAHLLDIGRFRSLGESRECIVTSWSGSTHASTPHR